MIFKAYVEFELGYAHFRIDAPTPLAALYKLTKWLVADDREHVHLEMTNLAVFEPQMSDPISEDDLVNL